MGKVDDLWEMYRDLRTKILHWEGDYEAIAGHPMLLVQGVDEYKRSGRFPFKALYDVRRQLPPEDKPKAERLYRFFLAYRAYRDTGDPGKEFSESDLEGFAKLIREAGDRL